MPKSAARKSEGSDSRWIPNWDLAFKTSAIYAVLGSLWILCSGWVVHSLVHDPEMEALLENLKGWLFILVTASLLWLTLDRYFREIRRSAKQLQESEQRWQFALEGAGHGVWDWDIDATTIFYSDGWKAMLGFAPHEIGNTLAEWESLVHPDDLAQVLVKVRQHLDGATPDYRSEHRLRCKDGTYKWILDRGKVLSRTADGKALRFLGTHSDITERKLAEDALQQRLELQDQFTKIATTVPGMICSFRLRPDGTASMPFATPVIADLYGLQPEDVRNDFAPAFTRVHPDDRLPLQEGIRESARTIQPWRGVFRVHHPARGELWIEGHSVPRQEPDGSVLWHGFVQDVTERRRVEIELRENLLFRREAERIARIGAWKVNPKIDYLYWTEGVYEIVEAPLDYKPGLQEGLKFYAPESIPIILEALNLALQDGTPFAVETQLITMTGRHLWTEVRGLARLEEGGQAFVMGTFQDITARKQAEQTVRESEERLRLALSAASQGLYDLNLQTGEIVVSPEYAVMLGYDPMEFRESPTFRAERLHPDDRDRAVNTFRDYVDGRIPDYAIEIRERTKSGHWKWFLSVGKIVARDQAGRPLRMAGTQTDITERKRAEEALRQSEERYRSLVETTLDWIWEIDAQGRYTYASPRVRDLLGYAPTEILGRTPFDFMSPGETERIRPIFLQVAAKREAFVGIENLNQHKDGHLVVLESSGVPVLGPDGELQGYRGMDRDITERKRLEAELRQAQKLEGIGQLAGGVAHDFNNILAAILMHLGLLQMNPQLDAETQRALSDLNAEARRAAELIRQLLMFSRRSVLAVKALDLNLVVSNLLKMLMRLIGEHIELRFTEGRDLPLVEADAGMLEQVLMNLVVNARDAIQKSGRVTISTAVVQLDPKHASENRDGRKGPQVVLEVSDSGCGMDAATLKRIFEPFFTTKEPGKGTGLGLATVHGIVAQHKGWVEVSSAVGQGTTFRVFLPALSATKVEAAQSNQAETLLGGRETILLVEDEAKVRELVGHALRSLGYRVFQAGNGQEAMRLWQKQGSDVDLLLTDMVMPEGMTGLDLTENLQALKPGLKVIISSGYSPEMVQAGVPTQPGVFYLPKPYDAKVLADVVRQALDYRAPNP